MSRPTVIAVMAVILCWVAAEGAWAAQFDGSSTHIEIPPAVAAALGTGAEASVSVRATLDAAGQGRRNEILCLTIDATYSKLVVGFADDNRLRVGGRTVAGEDIQSVRTTTAWPAGRELHIVAVVDAAADSIVIYVDGERQETEGEPAWAQDRFSAQVGERQTIGSSAYLRNHFRGELSDLLLFGRALSEAEVAALHEGRADEVSDEGILGRWLTSESEGTMMTDAADARGDWPPMVRTFSGSPREIGTAFGELHRETLQRGQQAWIARGAEHDLTPEDLLAMAEPMLEVVREITPHWLEEAEAIAEAAGIDPEIYAAQMLYIGPTARGGRDWFRPEEPDDCTSYTVSRDVTEGNAVFFHRTRDNTPGPQTGAIWETELPGINKLMAVTYTTSRSISVMVNDKGLVGSADQSQHRSTIRKDVGIMNGLMKRYIGERASNCEEALEIIQRFVDEGWYAGGRPGSRWTLVDSDGRILDVDHNSDPGSLSYRWREGKSHITRTWEGNADEMLEALEEPVAFLEFRNISRNPDSRIHRGRASIAGLTVRVHPEFPEYLTSAWFSFPAVSLAFPVYMGGTATPLPLVDGSLYELGADLPHDFETWEVYERSLLQNALLLEARAEDLLREGRIDEARALLDDWTQSVAATHLLLLDRSRR